MDYLLKIFSKLRRTSDRLSFENLAAFQNATGIKLTLCEQDILFALDTAWWEGKTRGS